MTRTLANSNLPLTRTNFRFPSSHFLYNFTLDNSNSRNSKLFQFPLKVRVIGGSRLFFRKCTSQNLVLHSECFEPHFESEAKRVSMGLTVSRKRAKYLITMRSAKTTARLTQRNIFRKQYFAWPNQPSSGLDVTKLYK